MSDGALVSSLLREQAPAWVSLGRAAAAGEFECEAHLSRRDGSVSAYHLRVRPGGAGEIVHVEEVEPRRLPAHCPDRHLWGGGGFCLGRREDYPARPGTPAESAAWWETLRGFLLLQDDVAYTRRWPASCSWPHDGTAIQADALLGDIARTLGVSVAAVSSWSRAVVGQREDGSRRVAGRRSPCPCGSGRQVRRCHEGVLTLVATVGALRQEANALFWASQEGRACCGTLEECPLRSGGAKETRR